MSERATGISDEDVQELSDVLVAASDEWNEIGSRDTGFVGLYPHLAARVLAAIARRNVTSSPSLAQIVAALSELADHLDKGESFDDTRLMLGGVIGWRSTVGPEPRRWWRANRAHRAGWLAGLQHAAEQIRRIGDADPADFEVAETSSPVSDALRAELLAQRIIAAREALLMGGQTADIRNQAALLALETPAEHLEVRGFAITQERK